jgi:hypothetical protein
MKREFVALEKWRGGDFSKLMIATRGPNLKILLVASVQIIWNQVVPFIIKCRGGGEVREPPN